MVTSRSVVPPLVSTEWLASNIDNPRLLIIDIRGFEDYLKGHIPKSVNVPFALSISAWTSMRNGLLLELPSPESLFNTLSSIGGKGRLHRRCRERNRPSAPSSRCR
ncbi:MAG: hypothetical protein HA491_00685 [Candidatus Verstraetearchaeota archaeon]|nr:hypothetical protein [Candidatus Verstraetearchaeota archaeon]